MENIKYYQMPIELFFLIHKKSINKTAYEAKLATLIHSATNSILSVLKSPI